MYADAIHDVLIARNTKSKIAEYIPHVFCKRTHYTDTADFILDCIAHNKPVDLIFGDYHLGGHKNGFELFDLFKGSPIRPFRMLHSNTRQTLIEHTDELLAGKYDKFSPSKSEKMILKRLKEYEAEILNVKLFGNPLYYSSYYDNLIDFTPSKEANNENGKLRLIDVICIETENSNHYITYRKIKNGSIEIVEREKFSSRKYMQEEFREKAEKLKYIRLNKSITANLLWVSKIDLIQKEKEVHFIYPDSCKHTKKIYSLSEKKEYINLLGDDLIKLPTQLHHYFSWLTE